MRNVVGVIVVAALAGCGGTSDNHWSKRPLETVSSTIDGTAFSIQLPKGMTKDEQGNEVDFDLREGGRVYTPSIQVRLQAHASTLEQYVASESGPFLRQEQVGDAFVVSRENDAYPGKQDFLVHVEKAIGERAFTCDARVTPFKKGDDVKKTMLPLVEAMCLSITAK